MDKFHIKVMASIYVWSTTVNGKPITTCGFLEDENHNLTLPAWTLSHEQHAAHIAIKLFRKYIAVDPRTLDIVPYGFFDPIRPPLDEQEMLRRTIHVCYKTQIHPGTPVHPTLRFMTHEELEIARRRIARGHYEAYRAGVSG